jgi:hypothetical protein
VVINTEPLVRISSPEHMLPLPLLQKSGTTDTSAGEQLALPIKSLVPDVRSGDRPFHARPLAGRRLGKPCQAQIRHLNRRPFDSRVFFGQSWSSPSTRPRCKYVRVDVGKDTVYDVTVPVRMHPNGGGNDPQLGRGIGPQMEQQCSWNRPLFGHLSCGEPVVKPTTIVQ